MLDKLRCVKIDNMIVLDCADHNTYLLALEVWP